MTTRVIFISCLFSLIFHIPEPSMNFSYALVFTLQRKLDREKLAKKLGHELMKTLTEGFEDVSCMNKGVMFCLVFCYNYKSVESCCVTSHFNLV